jgi:conjugal transfer/entry exclusion protein
MTLQDYLQNLSQVPNLLLEQLLETDEAKSVKQIMDNAKGIKQNFEKLTK